MAEVVNQRFSGRHTIIFNFEFDTDTSDKLDVHIDVLQEHNISVFRF
jgi:hypothetical protein